MVRGRGHVGALVVGALLCLGLSACVSPAPAPSPTPTGFADEEEAFAAAEATYRAYVDALNRVDLSDPATFEDVYAWTTGTANAEERKSLTGMHAEGWTVDGETRIESFTGQEYAPEQDAEVVAITCTDISSVAVVDASGESMVSPDRPDRYQLRLVFVNEGSAPHGLLIARSVAEESDLCG